MITFITWIKIVDFFPLFSYRVECLNNNIVSNIPGFIHHSWFLLAYTLNFHFPLLSIAGIVKPVSTNIRLPLDTKNVLLCGLNASILWRLCFKN